MRIGRESCRQAGGQVRFRLTPPLDGRAHKLRRLAPLPPIAHLASPTMSSTTLSISCHCTLNTFSIPLPPSTTLPFPSSTCSCSSCRFSTGALFNLSVPLPYTITGASLPLRTTLRAAKDSEGNDTTRWFCVRCGAHMFRQLKATHEETGERRWNARSAVVKGWNEGLVDVKAHGWVGDTKDGGLAVLLPEVGGRRLPMYTEGAGSEPFIPPLTTTSSASTADAANKGPLLVQCLCKTISLHLSRPSSTSTHLPSPSSEWPESLAHLKAADADSTPSWTTFALSTTPHTHFRAHSCICSSCTTTSGSPLQPWTFIPLHLLTPLASPHTPLTPATLSTLEGIVVYKSSDKVERTFCGGCGATVCYATEERGEVVDLSVGLLRAEEGARAERWLEWRRGVGRGGEEERSLGPVMDGFVEGATEMGTAEW